jgi:hypothetical protein
MKKAIFLPVLLSVFLFISCDELFRFFDTSNNGNDPNIRITKIDIYENDTINISSRQEFFYADNDKVNLILSSDNRNGKGTITEYGQSLFNYEGNKITENWNYQGTVQARTIYTFDGENLVKKEELYKKDDGTWFLETITEYTYQNEKLVSEVDYSTFVDYSTLKEEIKKTSETNYHYTGDLLTSYEYFIVEFSTSNYQLKKLNEYNLHYTGNRLDSILMSNINASGNLIAGNKQILTYSNDRLSEMTITWWDNTISNWGSPHKKIYEYDSKGLLKSYSFLLDNSIQSKTIYQWDEKSGNIELMWVNPFQRYLGLPNLKSLQIDKLNPNPYFIKIN